MGSASSLPFFTIDIRHRNTSPHPHPLPVGIPSPHHTHTHIHIHVYIHIHIHQHITKEHAYLSGTKPPDLMMGARVVSVVSASSITSSGSFT